MVLRWVSKRHGKGQGGVRHTIRNLPVLLSKNRICLSSWAVMVTGMVGWLMTRLIWLLPLVSANNIHILIHTIVLLKAASPARCSQWESAKCSPRDIPSLPGSKTSQPFCEQTQMRDGSNIHIKAQSVCQFFLYSVCVCVSVCVYVCVCLHAHTPVTQTEWNSISTKPASSTFIPYHTCAQA